MKRIFGILFLVLAALGLALRLTEPAARSEVPILYWVIDPAPARGEQIHLFHLWLVRNGHRIEERLETMADLRAFRARRWSAAMKQAVSEATPDGPAAFDRATGPEDLPLELWIPAAEMRLDAASNDLNKKIVQGVSGVAGDVLEAYAGGMQMTYLASAGMLADLTESAERLGFGPERTFPALRPSLFFDGRQMAFPRNVAQTMYWVNLSAFDAHGQPPPPARWTLDEFERRGRAFVEAAHPGGGRRTVFFADRAPIPELRRSLGLSLFNETLTRCTFDDPRNAELLARIYRWTYEDRILPSAADRAAAAAEGGWGGPAMQLFVSGRYGLFASGRWALMLLRRFGDLRLAVVEPPHGGFPNTLLSGGQSTVYARSPNRRFAELFLAFTADEEYNMQIVRSGDALPPNPAFVDTEAFLRPPDFPNEWGCHEAFARAAREIAIVQDFSPFLLPIVAARIEQYAVELVMSRRAGPEEAGARALAMAEEDIRRTLAENPALRAEYERRLALQGRIDAARAGGRPVPAEWILNPYHRRLYEANGWLLKEAPP